jgi:hypothetical protein
MYAALHSVINLVVKHEASGLILPLGCFLVAPLSRTWLNWNGWCVCFGVFGGASFLGQEEQRATMTTPAVKAPLKQTLPPFE